MTVFKRHCLLAADFCTTSGKGGSLIFCGVCGAFAEKRPQLLKATCLGKKAPGLAQQRRLLQKGRFPQSGSTTRLAPPVRLSTEQVRFLTDAAAEDSSDSDQELPPQLVLTRPQLLACYGVTTDLLTQMVAKEKAAEEQKKARRAEGHITGEDNES